MGGLIGGLLRVHLENGAVDRFPLSDETGRKFIGGSGLGAWLFLEGFGPELDPLSPENPLMILAGPLTGTAFPGSSRFAVCAKSPLTGIWGEASVGGTFGPVLKRAGCDGILILGSSARPVYMLVEDGRVELRDAGHLWGRDIYEATDALKAELGGQHKVLCIGQAGENLVGFAAIGNDKAHFAGRTGMGAVMGAKRLKAIAVKGSGAVPFAEEQSFREAVKAVIAACKESVPVQSLRDMGTDGAMDLGMMTGDVPIRNWSVGQDLALSAALGGPTLRETYLVKNHACTHCPVSCKRVVAVPEGPYRVEEGPGPEYETCGTFGTMLCNDNLAALIKANELCNRFGMDTISCGGTVAFAMECFERGLIGPADTDGLDLSWGNIDAVIALLPRIARREGIGGLLAEGSAKAAARLGGEAARYTVTVKGLELAMHDPRGFHGMGLAYAYSSRGACHNQHSALPVEQGWTQPAGVGLKEDYTAQSSEGKAEMVAICENYGLLLNCLCQCHFVNFATEPATLLKALNATTGWGFSMEDLLACGERIWHLKRGLVNLMGIRDEHDSLPERVLTPLADGAAAGSVPDLALMKREYKEIRGLGEDGVPRREPLVRLGLETLAGRLYHD
jgi:aldehyde:ferredoxin oxidoreductase